MLRFASICLFAYWLLIFVATHIPSQVLPRLGWSDKVYHMLAFSGLSFLLAWALPNRRGQWLSHLLIAGAIAVAYGCVDELTQMFIPGRSCDAWDVVADTCGTFLGLSAYVMCRTVLLELSWGRRLIQRLSN